MTNPLAPGEVPPRTSWASIYFNQDFVSVVACSGYFGCSADPDAYCELLWEPVSEEKLARAVLAALEASRFLAPDEVRRFSHADAVSERYVKWVEGLAMQVGRDGERALLKRLQLVNVARREGTIRIDPMRKHGAAGFEGLAQSRITLAAHTDESALGTAIREGMTRCLTR